MAMVRVDQPEIERLNAANARLTLSKKETSKEVAALTSAGARAGRVVAGAVEAAAVGALVGALADENGRIFRVIPEDAVAAGVGMLQIGIGIGMDSELAADAGLGLLAGAIYSASKGVSRKGKVITISRSALDSVIASPEFQALPESVKLMINDKIKAATA